MKCENIPFFVLKPFVVLYNINVDSAFAHTSSPGHEKSNAQEISTKEIITGRTNQRK